MSEPSVQVNSDGTAGPRPVEIPAAHVPKTQQIADILRGKAPAPAGEPGESQAAPEPSPGESPTPAPTKLDLATVAERLGLEPDALYDLEIGLGSDKVAKLGELKDRYRDLDGVEEARAEVAKQRGTWQADQIRAQREMDDLLSVLPQEAVTPQLQQAIERLNKDRISRETEALFRQVPEWSDAGIRTADVRLMTEYAAQFGVSEQELAAVNRAGLLALTRDAAKRWQKERRASQPPAPKPKIATAPRRAGQPTGVDVGRLRADVQAGRLSRTGAIGEILKGSGVK